MPYQTMAHRVWKKNPGLATQTSGFDTWFFGQPLSNFDGLVSEEKEISMLRQILADQKVLVLPHPNEILGKKNKYSSLVNVEVLKSKVPNDLLLGKIKPTKTITYGSTISLTYALKLTPDSVD